MESERERQAIQAVLLREDLLSHIFSHLPMQDSVRLQRVCKTWQRAGNHKWQNTKQLRSKDLKSHRFAEGCLQRLGHQITSVDLTHLFEGGLLHPDDLRILDKVAQWCPKLEVIKLEGYHMRAYNPTLLAQKCPLIRKFCVEDNSKSLSDHQFEFIFKNFPKIEFLEISCGSGFGSYFLKSLPPQMKTLICSMCDDVEIYEKVDLKNLKVLHLEGSRKVDCRFLRPSTKLEYLSFQHSYVTHLKEISKFKQLKSLYLDGIQKVKPEVLKAAFVDICRGCVNLEELSIAGPYVGPSALDATNVFQLFQGMEAPSAKLTLPIDGIAYLRKLRFFNFYEVVNAPQVVSALALSASNLEHLACESCKGDLDAPLIQLLRSCKRLTYLNVNDCPKVSAALLMAVNEEVASRNRVFTLEISDCNVSEQEIGTMVTSPLLFLSKNKFSRVPKMPVEFSQ